MTRIVEPAFTAAIRRAARSGDKNVALATRLDTEARLHGFGTWSSLLAADEAHTPGTCPAPFAWRTDIVRHRMPVARTGEEADMLRGVVYAYAAAIRTMDLFEEAGEGRSFEAFATIGRVSRIRQGSASWNARFPYFDDGEFDNDAYEKSLHRNARLSSRLLMATRDAEFYLRTLLDWPTIAAEFHGPVVFLDVRDGGIHRVGVRLVQHGGITWEARLDIGYSVVVTMDGEHPDREPSDTEEAAALLADAAPHGLQLRDMGLVPFAPAVRRAEGLWPHASGHAYENQGGDRGCIRGVVCRMVDTRRTMWRTRDDDLGGFTTGRDPA